MCKAASVWKEGLSTERPGRKEEVWKAANVGEEGLSKEGSGRKEAGARAQEAKRVARWRSSVHLCVGRRGTYIIPEGWVKADRTCLPSGCQWCGFSSV